ncbi:MAG: AAA family ATPase [Pseudomonadota bacterium]
MTERKVSMPRLSLWLVRLMASDPVQRRMVNDPMLFASWYAMGSDLLDWPEAAQAIQLDQRAKKLSLERALRLLGQLGVGNVGNQSSLKEARLLVEGYALHDWVTANWGEFNELAKHRAGQLDSSFEDMLRNTQDPTTLRITELCKILNLSSIEEKVLTLAFSCAIFSNFGDFLNQLMKERRSSMAQTWCAMLDCSEEELRRALSNAGILRTSRILRGHGKDNQLPRVSDFWVDLLTDPLESVFDSLLKPMVTAPGAGIPARMATEDSQLAVDILRNGAEKDALGVNLLLYGAHSIEKRSLLGELLSQAHLVGYVFQEFDNAYGELPCIAFVAQRVLYGRFGPYAVLVIERPGDVLERRPSEFLRNILGIELDSRHIAPLDQLLLDTNPAPTVWAGPGSDSLTDECVARFVFHAALMKAGREERRAQMENLVTDLKLYKATKADILALEDVSAKQIEAAVRAAKLSGAATKRERENAMVRAVRRSLGAMQRDSLPKAKECVTEYSLEHINHAGRFGPAQILQALKLRPKGSLCLYGPPGTGKTQFVEYLAQQMGQRLICKRASDLLSKWVGDNERNLAAMFQEAEEEEAILFLDEGDSFLRDRNLANQSWEVTKVNELLQGMERFPGVFIVATNLFRGLDTAALRRFTFRLELRALNPEQRWNMFVSETGIKKTLAEIARTQKDSWKANLYQMHQLAAGDFATVKRQCMLLGEILSPDQWIEQLQIECDIKRESQAREISDTPSPPEGAKAPAKLVH